MIKTFLFTSLRNNFAKLKRIKELGQAKITLDSSQSPSDQSPNIPSSYYDLRSVVDNLGWQSMPFDKLCSLPASVLSAIEMEIKKDKFNVSDSEFEEYSSHLKICPISQLGPYYKRTHALLTNDHKTYDQLRKNIQIPHKYMGQLYVEDLTKNKELKAIITHFINNLLSSKQLETIVEPSFIKKLLMMKRQLIMQGIKFQVREQRLQTQKKYRMMVKSIEEGHEEEEGLAGEEEEDGEDGLTNSQRQVKLSRNLAEMMEKMQSYNCQVDIVEVLGYEHQFWVDVKHNRSKNGTQEDYLIQQRQIAHPNPTLLLTETYPKISVKYIVHKQKRKDYAMNFCSKAELLVRVNNQHLRRVKVEWCGPANKQSLLSTDFKVIDYEQLMNGNPTVPFVFSF